MPQNPSCGLIIFVLSISLYQEMEYTEKYRRSAVPATVADRITVTSETMKNSGTGVHHLPIAGVTPMPTPLRKSRTVKFSLLPTAVTQTAMAHPMATSPVTL